MIKDQRQLDERNFASHHFSDKLTIFILDKYLLIKGLLTEKMEFFNGTSTASK